MDRNLANYLFHGETIYLGQEKLAKPEISPKEVVEVPALEVKADIATVPKVKEDLAVAVEAVPEILPFKMNTAHLIVVAGINTEEKDFLVKVLLALNMSLAKADLLDASQHPNPNFKEIIYNNTVRTILFLGADSGGEFLPKLKLLPYQVREIKQIRFLTSAKLHEVSQNLNNEKRQLWESLKELYN